jgi:uncharacterized protein (TIGR03437 family)
MICVDRISNSVGMVLLFIAPMWSQSPTWSTKAPMPTARESFGVGVINGIVYAVGGVADAGELNTVEAYDPVSDTWTTKAPMPTARYGLGVGVVNGLLYAVGGEDGAGGYPILNTMEVYDPATDTWTTKAPMPTGRTNLAVGAVDGILYAVGGSNPAVGLNTVEAYDPVTGVWHGCAPLHRGRSYLGVGVIGHRLYAVGGADAGNINASKRVTEAYDPSSNSWTDRAEMPRDRLGFGTAVAGGILYAVGGLLVGEVDSYDPASNRWSTPSGVPTVRYGLSAAAIGGVVYALGGYLGFGRGSVGLNEALDLHIRPSIDSGGVVNAASFRAATDPSGAIAPGAIVSIFGSNLAQGAAPAAPGPLPATLAGASVFFNGISAALFYASPELINAEVPVETSTGIASVEVHRGDTVSFLELVTVTDLSPGLFTANATGSGVPAGFWIRAAANGAQTQDYLFDPAKPIGNRLPVPVDLGATGDQVFLSLYGTGFRNASHATAIVGDVSVPVAGFAPVGVYQGEDVVNIGPLPRSLTARGEVSVVLAFDGKTANTVTVSIR